MGAPLIARSVTRDQNAALLMIDYQPSQFAAVQSMDRDLLLANIVSTVKIAKLFDLPIVHSTITATANAVYHATDNRVRGLPITLDKPL